MQKSLKAFNVGKWSESAKYKIKILDRDINDAKKNHVSNADDYAHIVTDIHSDNFPNIPPSFVSSNASYSWCLFNWWIYCKSPCGRYDTQSIN